MAAPHPTPRSVDYAALIGLRTTAPLAVAERVRAGLGYRAFDRFRRHAALSAEGLADLVHIPARTLARRRAAGRLDPDESDRLVRLARVFALALRLFQGNETEARRWLLSPRPALGGGRPLEVATTEPGARAVENLIGQLEHGIPV